TALEVPLPRHPRQLNATYVPATTIVENVEHGAAHDAVAQHRIAQPALEGPVTVRARPVGHQHADARVRGRVRIDVHHHVHARLTSRIHHGKRADALPPHGLAHHLVVGEYHGNARLTTDPDRLRNALDKFQSLLPEVGRVDAAGIGRLTRQRDDLVSL